ncbi:hypothetical protein AB1A65_05665 [Muricauda sp. ANG21]|uniref:hypothetical protein n=1 Tax=Allomuricauda sp. ANG21 TaxID=3042468 RepID=UPI0034553569
MKHFTYIFTLLVLLLNGYLGMTQVKIGQNLQTIHPSSILELESNSKAFVLTRVSQDEMIAIVPLPGALVFNTDTQCIHMFDGGQWENLCDKGVSITASEIMPTGNQEGDIWIDTSQDLLFFWNGTAFIPIGRTPYRGSGAPMTSIVPNPLAGDIYVDIGSGDLYTYDGSNWLIQGNGILANNGITESDTNTIELGGTLIKPTTITTDNTNTLAIQGLEITHELSNRVVVMDAATGVLRATPMSTIMQREETVIVANDGQNQFSTPLQIINEKKIDVYRNGIRIDFTVVGSNTIELVPDARCFQNDEIRIIQFF